MLQQHENRKNFGGYRAQCEGKTRWGSEEGVRRFLQGVRRANPGHGLTPYRCQFCHRWHIGHV